jgi:hypothetical protein
MILGVHVKHIALFVLVFTVFAVAGPVVVFAGDTGPTSVRPSEIALPVVESFEDGDCRLRLIGMPSADLTTMQVTLVYEDRALRILNSVTVNPDVVATSNDPKFNAFITSMDRDFVSFVRATLADRLLHLTDGGNVLDRSVSALFFRTTDSARRSARLISAVESAE